MKSKYSIHMIVRGSASAYSPVELEDRLKDEWSEISNCLFDDLLPYYITIKDENQQKISFTGMKISALEKKVAYQLYWHDYNRANELYRALVPISRHLYEQSGLIFKDVRAISAAKELDSYMANLDKSLSAEHTPHSYSDLETILSEEKQLKYRKQAQCFMEETFDLWSASLIVPDND